MDSFSSSIVPLIVVSLGAYVTYLAWTKYEGTPTGDALKEFQTANYYADDQLTPDSSGELCLSGAIKVMKLDNNLYNVDTGSGAYVQVDKRGLNDIVKNNERQINVQWQN